jgi:hypothetical protein
MSSSKVSSPARRNFLKLAGGSAAVAHWLTLAVNRAEGAEAPKRLILIQRPNGSVSEDWIRGTAPGPILEPFKDVWANAVALKGVDVRPSNGSTGGSHEAGLVTIMTGAKLGNTDRTNDDFKSSAESLDQTLIKRSALLKGSRVASIQAGAHGDQDGGNETPNVTMSYSGPGQPLYPTLNPYDVYKRVFGAELMPGGGTAANLEELKRKRAKKQSVLDFISWDLTRAKAAFPAEAKADLESHTSAVREVEMNLDTDLKAAETNGGAGCMKPAVDMSVKAGGDYLNTAKVGGQHLKLIAAAFRCDLTHVATFQWATGASRLSFGPLGSNNHHSTSHANSRGPLSAIDKWFSEQTAIFIRELAASPDLAGGTLLNNTLVWYLNEVSEGHSHSFNDYPFVLFGGDGVGLKTRGRVFNVAGKGFTSNDVWTSLAPAFGTTLSGFGTKSTGAIPGLFEV